MKTMSHYMGITNKKYDKKIFREILELESTKIEIKNSLEENTSRFGHTEKRII